RVLTDEFARAAAEGRVGEIRRQGTRIYLVEDWNTGRAQRVGGVGVRQGLHQAEELLLERDVFGARNRPRRRPSLETNVEIDGRTGSDRAHFAGRNAIGGEQGVHVHGRVEDFETMV